MNQMYPKGKHFRKKSEKIAFQMEVNIIMKLFIDLLTKTDFKCFWCFNRIRLLLRLKKLKNIKTNNKNNDML